MIRAPPHDSEHWKSFKVIITYSENVKTFEAISKNLKMEKECIKINAPPSVAFIAKGPGPRGKGPYRGKKRKKGLHPP